MSFVRWNNQNKCTNSLAAVNDEYGCPYELLNGYKMTLWDVMTESLAGGEWGFFAPESRPGKSEEDLMDTLDPSYTMTDEQPDGWTPEGEEEDEE